MSWYDSAWNRRQAVAVDNTSGGTGIDISIELPGAWSSFWDAVAADGDDIRITKGDGTTLLAYALDSWNSTTRVGTIQVDNYDAVPNAGQDATVTVFVYWDNATAAAGASVITFSSAKTGTVHLAAPRSGHYPIIKCRPQPQDQDITPTVISKQSTETIRAWWDLRDMMAILPINSQGSNRLEEIEYFTFNVVTAIDEDAAAALFDETKNYLRDPHMISTLLKAGGDDSNYLMTLTVYTTEGRVLDFRATLKVNDQSASLTTV